MAKTEKPQAVEKLRSSRYPPDDIQGMAEAKGFKNIEEMVEFFIDKQMGLYYNSKEEK